METNTTLTNKVVYIMRGIPGSGKNWYIENTVLPEFPDASVCSADDYHMINGVYNWKPDRMGFAHTSCREKFFEALRKGVSCVVVNNTNTTQKEMRVYYETAKESGYKVVFVRMVISPELSFKRNVHKVPMESIKRMQERFQDIPNDWGTELVIPNE